MLQIDCLPQFAPVVDMAHLEALAQQVLAGEGLTQPADLSLTITDDAGICAINREYRDLDAPTDVLSFSLLPAAGEAFVSPPDGVLHLGDIVISFERAAAQATGMGHSIRQELGELLVHGLLHILGYDHEDAGTAAAMAAKADRYTA